MVGRRRDPRQRATRTVSRRVGPDPKCKPLGGPCLATDICKNTSDRQSCVCSNLLYILTAACDACDLTNPSLSWDQYQQRDGNKCGPTPSPNPSPLPPPTAQDVVPEWALEMAAQTPMPTVFNLDDALSLLSAPVSSQSATSTASSDASSATSLSTDATSTDTGTPTPNNPTPNTPTPTTAQPSPASGSSKNSSQAGPIAGGIIGAIVLLLLIGLGIWYRIRRRRNHIAPSAAYKAAVRAGNPSPMPYQPVRGHSPKNSTDDLTTDHSLGIPSRPISIRSESRFREHTMS